MWIRMQICAPGRRLEEGSPILGHILIDIGIVRMRNVMVRRYGLSERGVKL
jgi:hypothetical protein